MFNHSLIFLALISFSIVSHAAAIPMDADQAPVDATQNAVLHKDVAARQGGDSDRDVAAQLSVVATDSCAADAICTHTDVSIVDVKQSTLSDWFVAGDSASALQPLAALLVIGLIVFFLSRKSASTK